MSIKFEDKSLPDDGLEVSTDELLDYLAEIFRKADSVPAVVNERKVEQVKSAYAIMQQLTEGTDVKVSYELHKPYMFSGSVSVEGEILAFSNPELFARAAEFATNTEIYPLTNHNVRMTFSFDGLTIPVV